MTSMLGCAIRSKQAVVSQHLPRREFNRNDHYNLNPLSKPRPRAGVRGLRRYPRMKKIVIACILPIIAFMASCKEKEPTRMALLVGAKSFPAFEDLQVGKEVPLGECISVAGSGDFGEKKWGKISIDWMDNQKIGFESGGVVSWSPLKCRDIRVTGDLNVPLVAYLLKVSVDDQMHPKKMWLIQKWKLQPGAVEIAHTNN